MHDRFQKEHGFKRDGSMRDAAEVPLARSGKTPGQFIPRASCRDERDDVSTRARATAAARRSCPYRSMGVLVGFGCQPRRSRLRLRPAPAPLAMPPKLGCGDHHEVYEEHTIREHVPHGLRSCHGRWWWAVGEWWAVEVPRHFCNRYGARHATTAHSWIRVRAHLNA